MKKNKLVWAGITVSLLIRAQSTVGLQYQSDLSKEGYVLFAPNYSKNTYLIDKCGRQVHCWKSKSAPGQSVYLLPDGKLLRTATDTVTTFAGDGGKIEKLDWDSKVLWSYTLSNDRERRHHDIYPMPNGNILVLAWEKRSQKEALKAGRSPEILEASLWSEKIIEIKPVGTNSALVVWEWRVWDHLVQDVDQDADNFGVVADNPQLININYALTSIPDWLHFNSVTYHPKLDQIMVSNRNYGEIFIIDHATTTEQAASHTGGAHNKGGDLLYRWGNPRTYNRGTKEDQKFFNQHSAYWIDPGFTDGGKIMVFNNGTGRPGKEYSSVEVIAPPTDEKGNYILEKEKPYLPVSADWQYKDSVPENFYSRNLSGAQRLSNGNTLICEGAAGKFFEIGKHKNIVWTYVNPVVSSGPAVQGEKIKQNQVFRCILYEPSYSGFKGRTLTPGKPIELKPSAYTCTTRPKKTKKP